jgi:hypothetical protein
MEKQKSPVLRTLCTLAFAFAVAFGATAHGAGSGYVHLGKYKTKDGKWVSAVYKPTPKKTLALYRPSKLISDGEILRNNLRRQCTKSGNAVVNFALKQYPVESTTFNLAVGLAAGEQLKEDPAYARHFIEQSYLDPMGHVSFMGFMLGNRAAATLFSMTGMTYDPCRILKRNPLAPVEAFEERQFQKYMRFVEGPVGMAAGMLLSDIGRQALSDKNIRLCARYEVGAVHGEKARTEARQACDDAYNDWVLEGGDKIRELIPDMINMGAVVTAMSIGNGLKAKLLSPAITAAKRGAMKAVDEATLRFTVAQSARYVIWEGFDVAVRVASAIPAPVTKFGVAIKMAASSVASIYVFNWLQDKFSPIIKKPISVFMQGSDIEKTLVALDQEIARTRANKWNFVEQPKPDYCDPDIVRMSSMATGVYYMPKECYTTPEKPADLIVRLGKLEKKWRDFIMSDTMVAANNWQDYVLNFANIYTDARKFYFGILKRVWTLRARPNEPDALKEHIPLGGVPVDLTAWQSRKVCDLPAETQMLFEIAVDEINKQIVELQKPSIALPTMKWSPSWGWDGHGLHPRLITYKNDGRLKNPLSVDRLVSVADMVKLKEGFKAMNCKYKLENISRDLHKDEKLATPAEIESLRWRRYTASATQLYWNLNAYPYFGSVAEASDPNDPAYEELATTNIYMRVNMILASAQYGGPEPMFPGVQYIKSRRYDPTDIVQSMKNQHPKTLGRIDTAHMPEYLLASMLCGPYAQNSIEKKAHWSVNFRPPRVIPDIGVDVCGLGDMRKSVNGRMTTMVQVGRPHFHIVGAELPHYDAHMSVWTIKGKKYKGMLEILKAFASPSVIGGSSESNIVNWWAKNLGSQAEPLFKQFRDEFVREVLGKKFFPAVVDSSRSSDHHWIVANSKGLAKGLTGAMNDSINEHLGMLEPMVLNHPLSKQDLATYKSLVTAVRTHMKIGLMMLAPPKTSLRPAIDAYTKAPDVEFDPNKWDEQEWALSKAVTKQDLATALARVTGPLDENAVNAFRLNQIDLKHALMNLQEFALQQAEGPSKATLVPLINAIMGNFASMVTDIDAYHGFLVSIRLEVSD